MVAPVGKPGQAGTLLGRSVLEEDQCSGNKAAPVDANLLGHDLVGPGRWTRDAVVELEGTARLLVV